MTLRRRTRVKDNFEGSNYTLTGSQTSSNGKWTCDYNGGGTVEVKSDNVRTSKIMRTCPAAPIPETLGSTRAAKVDSTTDVYDFECTFDMKTFAQTKGVGNTNNWEVAWFMWHYTDGWHHYYMLIQKDGGLELGRKDYATQIEQQQFLVTNGNTAPSFVMGQWYNVKIRMVGFNIKVWIDGTLQCNITDDGTFGYDSNGGGIPPAPTAAMLHGTCCFYGEDSDCYYDNFVMRAL